EPTVLVCDEVTSALDVSVQASIIDLLLDLQRDDGLAMIFITHNLALVQRFADRVQVMAAGSVIEEIEVRNRMIAPKDQYTNTLLAATPSVQASVARHPPRRTG